jgi:hypothetical protein
MELNRNDSINILKLRILVTFNITFFERFRGKFNYKESYNIKKSVNEVLIFNDNIIRTLSERVKLSFTIQIGVSLFIHPFQRWIILHEVESPHKKGASPLIDISLFLRVNLLVLKLIHPIGRVIHLWKARTGLVFSRRSLIRTLFFVIEFVVLLNENVK